MKYRNIFNSMDSILSSFKAYDSLMSVGLSEKWLEATKAYQSALDMARFHESALDMAKFHQSTLDFAKIHGSAINLARAQEKALDLAYAHERALDLARLQEKVLDLARIHEKAYDLARIEETFLKASESAQMAFDISSRYENLLRSQLLSEKAMTSLYDIHSRNIFEAFDSLSNLPAFKFSLENLGINTDGSLTYGDENVPLNELSESIENFFSDIDRIDFFDKFWERLEKLKTPIRVFIIWIVNHIIVAYIVGLSAGVTLLHRDQIQDALDKFSFRSHREVTTYIKKIAPEINLKHLESHRVVTAERLHLREKPSRKSRIIYELNRGKLVRVLRKNRNWTMVEVVFDNEDESLEGWVFTRYITKVKR